MDVKSLEELQRPDDRAGYFTPGLRDAEAVAEYHQQAIRRLELASVVPEQVRAAFDQLRELYGYGVLWYDLYTVAHDRARLILEYALRERFLSYYGGTVTFLDSAAATHVLRPKDFEELFEEIHKERRLRSPKVWKLRVDGTGRQLRFDGMLDSLLRWARLMGLLHGQRNRNHETLLKTLRNRAAHGTGYHLLDPGFASTAISDLAEIINRLWEATTPGGRLYPAPIRREVAAVAWNASGTITWGLAEGFRSDVEPGAWTCVLVRAALDDELAHFDAQYEATRTPCELLWGPGTPEDAAAWRDLHHPAGDEVGILDRLFMVRHHNGRLYLPRSPETAAGLTALEQVGTWYLMRADSPFEVFSHLRQLLAGGFGCTSADHCQRPGAPCPVQSVTTGTWEEVLDVVEAEEGHRPMPRAAPDVRAPSGWPRWNEDLANGSWSAPAQ
jgi:hypothetical protein